MESDIGPEESVSTAVIRAASAVEGEEPWSLPSLEAIVDPDALNALFAPRPDGSPRPGGRLSFVYSDCHVTVDNGEYLTLELLDPSSTDGCRVK